MLTEILYAGLAVGLALLIAIFLRLMTLPAALRAQGRRERAEGQDEAMTMLREKAALSVGAITAALSAHEDRLATEHREESATVEVRARLAERRAAEAALPVETALELVRELRGTIDALGSLPAMLNALRELDRTAARAAPDQLLPDSARKTVEMPSQAPSAPPGAGDDGGDEPEEELTKVLDRPDTKPRRGLRPPVFAPAVAPPASSPILPPEPAQVAAGLGQRPGARSRPASGAPPRAATMSGIQPAARPAMGTAPTLPSMQAPVIAAEGARKDGVP